MDLCAEQWLNNVKVGKKLPAGEKFNPMSKQAVVNSGKKRRKKSPFLEGLLISFRNRKGILFS
jgi:hypothetical protein